MYFDDELEKSEIVLKNISNDINKIISNPIKLDEVPKYYKKLLNHKVNDIKVLIRLRVVCFIIKLLKHFPTIS